MIKTHLLLFPIYDGIVN